MKPTRIVFVRAIAVLLALAPVIVFDAGAQISSGELQIKGGDDLSPVCPLTHTEVQAEIVGLVSRTTLWQTFENPLDQKIEAVYVFPLPQDAAVDEMIIQLGERTIMGVMMPRPEARKTYERAKRQGQVASLLDQERPNIFTQSVANIEPGARIVIQLSYLETLKFQDGVFEYVFPMTVGPRYIPGRLPEKEDPDEVQTELQLLTDERAKVQQQGVIVPDARKLNPPMITPEMRAGHEIELSVRINGQLPLSEVESVLHEVDIDWGEASSTVSLKRLGEIPNRDFILKFCTASDQIEDSLLLYTDERGGFFTLFLQPPRWATPEQILPKEMIFVIDCSGSMSGFPIEKAKETMAYCIDRLNPEDTFNLISFSGGTGSCFECPMPNTEENRQKALQYLGNLRGGGGTEMMKALKIALEDQLDAERLRVVCLMTDGFIGNDFELIDAVQRNAGSARLFAFGAGNSVNRFLLDGMARAGRGAVEYVTLRSGAELAAMRFYQRVHAPVMTEITIDWSQLPVLETFPASIPDLFSEQPIMVHGRLSELSGGNIVLRGRTAGGLIEEVIPVKLADASESHECLASLWARAKVGNLMRRDLRAMQRNNFPAELKEEIIELAMEFCLMTQFTSFVAVEVERITEGDEARKMAVPAHLPEGVSKLALVGGATTDLLWLLLGAILLTLGGFTFWQRRRLAR